MLRFDDYHRTIIGYHGTKLSVALDIVNRRKNFEFSENDTDWLGRGVYFWEYAPQQALWWADRLKKRSRKRHEGGKRKGRDLWDEPIAILGVMIRLRFCLDLLDPFNIKYAKRVYENFRHDRFQLGLSLPKNVLSKRRLDCAVFEYLYASLEGEGQPDRAVDTARAAYVTTDEKKRIWPGSWIYEESHIQVCVRNPACILGTWLHYPPFLGEGDALQEAEVAEVDVKHPDRAGGQATGSHVAGREDPTSSEGQASDPGAGGSGEA